MIRSSRARAVLAVLALLLPNRLRRLVYVRALGHEIAPDAVVGRSIIDVRHLVVGPGARIGHLNLIRHLDRLELGHEAEIGHFNWISGVRVERGYFPDRQRAAELVLADSAAITHLHFVDCCDRIELGRWSILGGVRSQILTHGVDIDNGGLTSAPVLIGERVLINSGSLVMPGTVVSGRCVVAGGSMIRGKLLEEQTVYVGSPAKPKRALPADRGWLVRDESHMV